MNSLSMWSESGSRRGTVSMSLSTCTERPGDQRAAGPDGRSALRANHRSDRQVSDLLAVPAPQGVAASGLARNRAITRGQVIRLAVVHDYALVNAGVAGLVANSTIDVVQTETTPTDEEDVDIVLYDPCGPGRMSPEGLETWLGKRNAKVVIYSWDLRPEVAQRAVRHGAAGCLAKSLPGPVMVAALKRIMLGETVVITEDNEGADHGVANPPRHTDGLSPRETEVLALIASGSTNQEIAARLDVSINSVKAYIRSAYRKIGVQRRTQAVLWGVRNGLSSNADPQPHS
jgi:two-component system, NarL family, response regulator LiaR